MGIKSLTCLSLVFALLGAAPIYYGSSVTPGMPTFNVLTFGAKGNHTTDDTAAFTAAIAAAIAAGGGTIYIPSHFPNGSCTNYKISGALAIPYTGAATNPQQPHLRITGDGADWNSRLSSSVSVCGGMDLQYTGGDGLHPAKIDTRGTGLLELDHLTIEDTASDNFLFLQTTNTALNIHDNAIIGNPANSGTANLQDFARLGSSGNWAATVGITNGTTTLTIGGGDPPFTAAMVGDFINYSAAGVLDSGGSPTYSSTIAAYISPTQVTLANAATTTITGGEANYFNTGSDATSAYQGYTSRFTHNLYSHIRRSAIFGNFSNGSSFNDELYDFTDGCGTTIPNCAPYYFDRASSYRLGNIIRAAQGEVANYPFFVSLVNYAKGNAFDNLAPDDPTATNFGVVYYASASTEYNRESISYPGVFGNSPQVATTIAGTISPGVQTVTPASMTGILTTSQILIDPDGSGIQEWVTPSAVTGSTFTANFAFAHGANTRVLGNGAPAAGAGYAINTVQVPSLLATGNTFPGATTLGNASVGQPITVATQLVANGTIVSKSGSILPISSGAGVTDVRLQYNNSATGGVSIYDGGSTTHSVVLPNKVDLSNSNGSGTQRTFIAAGTGTCVSTAGVSPTVLSVCTSVGSNIATDVAGNVGVGGHLTYTTPAATCGAAGFLPCSFTWTCTMSSGACTTTQAVPAASSCHLEPNVSPVVSTTNVVSHWATLSSTTLTVHVADELGTATSAFSGSGICI